jgi:hypothetical protein
MADDDYDLVLKHGGSPFQHPHPANTLAIFALSWHTKLLQSMTTLLESAIGFSSPFDHGRIR